MAARAGLAQLGGLTALQDLDISGCERISDLGVASLAPLTRHSLANICAHGCPGVHAVRA
jgi:hypothetical protein